MRPDPDGIAEYSLPGSDRHVSAITFSRFLDYLTEVDLDQVDPQLIAEATAPPVRMLKSRSAHGPHEPAERRRSRRHGE